MNGLYSTRQPNAACSGGSSTAATPSQKGWLRTPLLGAALAWLVVLLVPTPARAQVASMPFMPDARPMTEEERLVDLAEEFWRISDHVRRHNSEVATKGGEPLPMPTPLPAALFPLEKWPYRKVELVPEYPAALWVGILAALGSFIAAGLATRLVFRARASGSDGIDPRWGDSDIYPVVALVLILAPFLAVDIPVAMVFLVGAVAGLATRAVIRGDSIVAALLLLAGFLFGVFLYAWSLQMIRVPVDPGLRRSASSWESMLSRMNPSESIEFRVENLFLASGGASAGAALVAFGAALGLRVRRARAVRRAPPPSARGWEHALPVWGMIALLCLLATLFVWFGQGEITALVFGRRSQAVF